MPLLPLVSFHCDLIFPPVAVAYLFLVRSSAMNTAKPILIAVLIGIAALFAARECHRRSEGARFQAIVQGSTAFVWRPERVAAARQRARPYLLAAHLWAGAA